MCTMRCHENRNDAWTARNKGYEIHSARSISRSFDVWEVILKRQDFFVKFSEERGGLDIFFGSPSKGYINIRSLIYFLSDGKIFVDIKLFDIFHGMKKEASLLQKHIDEFESCFGSEFPKYEEDLKFAEQRYSERVSPKVGPTPKPRVSPLIILYLIAFWLVYSLVVFVVLNYVPIIDIDSDTQGILVGVLPILLAVITTYKIKNR